MVHATTSDSVIVRQSTLEEDAISVNLDMVTFQYAVVRTYFYLIVFSICGIVFNVGEFKHKKL